MEIEKYWRQSQIDRAFIYQNYLSKFKNIKISRILFGKYLCFAKLQKLAKEIPQIRKII